jgi:hypothetical protein
VARIEVDGVARPRLLNWFDAVTAATVVPAGLAAAAVLADAGARWRAYAAAEDGALAAALDAAGGETPGVPLGPESPSRVDVLYPLWHDNRLTVIGGRRSARSSEQRRAGGYGCGKYDRMMEDLKREAVPSPMPCTPMERPEVAIRRGYRADVALVLEYDGTGALIEERRFAPHAVPGPAPVATEVSDRISR